MYHVFFIHSLVDRHRVHPCLSYWEQCCDEQEGADVERVPFAFLTGAQVMPMLLVQGLHVKIQWFRERSLGICRNPSSPGFFG